MFLSNLVHWNPAICIVLVGVFAFNQVSETVMTSMLLLLNRILHWSIFLVRLLILKCKSLNPLAMCKSSIRLGGSVCIFMVG